MTIAQVDFGRLDAEGENNLGAYFVDTGVLKRILSGERQFVIGRKGSGKTALFRQAQTALVGRGLAAVPLEFADYAWETHKAIREVGLLAESAYTSSWTFTFLMAMCNAWRQSADRRVKQEAERLYRQVYGAEDPTSLELLIDKVRRLRKFDLPSAEGIASLGGFELDEPEGTTLARAANVWNQKLLALADGLYNQEAVTVLADKLDDGWDASEEIRQMLAGAIKAARTLNLRYNRPDSPKPVLIFLRSDIFNELQFNDKNKVGPDTELLEWDDESLIGIINARIASSLGGKRDDAWDRVFSAKPMRQRASVRSYVLKRTMKRPRDIVAFANYCKEVAVKAGNAMAETLDVYEAEKAYSRHTYNELIDEIHKQVPEHSLLFKALRLVGYTRFKLPDWKAAIVQLRGNVDNNEAGRLLKTLFDYAVVGVPKVGGKGGGSGFEFVYDDPLLEPSFDGEMVVHLALRKHLALKDARADSGDDGDDMTDGTLDF